jgi:DNA polymerase-3 subunit delta'
MSQQQNKDPAWIKEQLHDLFERKGHAWLLQGPSGLGQYELALSLAKAWLCQDPQNKEPCGKCQSCHLIDVKSHPDLQVLLPELQMLDLEWPLGEKAQKDIDDKDRKPSKEIRVEAVKEMVEFTQRTSSGLNPKVVLIYPAERLNIYAANMILKTLEEPAGDTRFILASEASHQLLPTIRSRCQTHTMHWPSKERAIEWLTANGLDQSEAQTLLKAAGDRPSDARILSNLGITASQWNAIPKSLQRGDTSQIAGLSPTQVLLILQKICTDLVAIHCNFEPRYFSASVLPRVNNFELLTGWFKELSSQLKSSEHPFNAGLMIESLSIQASKILRA